MLLLNRLRPKAACLETVSRGIISHPERAIAVKWVAYRGLAAQFNHSTVTMGSGAGRRAAIKLAREKAAGKNSNIIKATKK